MEHEGNMLPFCLGGADPGLTLGISAFSISQPSTRIFLEHFMHHLNAWANEEPNIGRVTSRFLVTDG